MFRLRPTVPFRCSVSVRDSHEAYASSRQTRIPEADAPRADSPPAPDPAPTFLKIASGTVPGCSARSARRTPSPAATAPARAAATTPAPATSARRFRRPTDPPFSSQSEIESRRRSLRRLARRRRFRRGSQAQTRRLASGASATPAAVSAAGDTGATRARARRPLRRRHDVSPDGRVQKMTLRPGRVARGRR